MKRFIKKGINPLRFYRIRVYRRISGLRCPSLQPTWPCGEGYKDIAKISVLVSLIISTVISGLYFLAIDKIVLPKKPSVNMPKPVVSSGVAMG